MCIRATAAIQVALVVSLAAWLVGCDDDDSDYRPGVEVIVVADDGEGLVLDWSALRQLPVVEGYGGILNTAGTITPPQLYEGVSLVDVLESAGGVPSGSAVQVVAGDDYSITITANQAAGDDLITFDPETGEPTTVAEGVTSILAYDVDGGPLNEDDGPLRLVFVSPEANQLTDGHFWVKDVVRLQIVEGEEDWTLSLRGAREEDVSRALFEAGAAPGCHMASWIDGEGAEWTGIPLWLLVGWVDDENVHRTDSFNRELAATGYDIDIVAQSGEQVTLTSDRVSLDNGIILANRRDGETLSEENAPLRLVGDGLDGTEHLGGVVEVVLHVE